MGCCSCKYLDENNKKEGKVTGCSYFCKKRNCYVLGNSSICDGFSNDYSRKSYISDDIYNNGKAYYNDNTSIGFYLFILFYTFNFNNYAYYYKTFLVVFILLL